MWKCDFENCEKPSVRTSGDCILCDRHLCANHLKAKYHTCPKWEDDKYDPAAEEADRREITKLLEKVNVSALLSRASQLRNGIACSIPPHALKYDPSTRSPMNGEMNYHMEIQFEDGISWLACIRRFNATSPPPNSQDYIMRSEVATLQFLSKANVPTPKVFDSNFDKWKPH